MGHSLAFQYISCYCLSGSLAFPAFARFISIHLMLLFIVLAKWQFTSKCISIHLMLLFISKFTKGFVSARKFQYISCYCLSWRCYSIDIPNGISIHLMLLFIYKDKKSLTYIAEFQYISCYCLSTCGWAAAWDYGISIHLMLLFILNFFQIIFVTINISIHLMLLFISFLAWI